LQKATNSVSAFLRPEHLSNGSH